MRGRNCHLWGSHPLLYLEASALHNSSECGQRSMKSVVFRHIAGEIERRRYLALRDSFRGLRPWCRGRVLDFGASFALSMLALRDLGIQDVDGVEVQGSRVRFGRRLLQEAGGDPSRLLHVPETQYLPYPTATFDTVLANAVLEHIPQPRTPYLKELWRVLKPGGHLIVTETPNRYLPFDYHTTHLWWIPWLPSRLARRYAIWRGRFRPDKAWAFSGWRGLGYYELAGAFPRRSFEVVQERSRLRHRVLRLLGLPASLLDPYPVWILRKTDSSEVAGPVSSAPARPALIETTEPVLQPAEVVLGQQAVGRKSPELGGQTGSTGKWNSPNGSRRLLQ